MAAAPSIRARTLRSVTPPSAPGTGRAAGTPIVEADLSWEGAGGDGFITIHHIDIPDVDHTAAFSQVSEGWWIYLSVPGKTDKRIHVNFVGGVDWGGDVGAWMFGGAREEPGGGTVPSAGDDTSVWLQKPDGSFLSTVADDSHASDPGSFTIADLEAWVDDHPDMADEVLAHEQARPSPRVTLVNWLQGFISDRDPGHVP